MNLIIMRKKAGKLIAKIKYSYESHVYWKIISFATNPSIVKHSIIIDCLGTEEVKWWLLPFG